MPRYLLLVISLLAILLIAAQLLYAGVDDQGNPNDPHVNERANACFEGGSMAGKCDAVNEWEAGWYLIRFEAGLISREQVPLQHSWTLPNITVGTDEP